MKVRADTLLAQRTHGQTVRVVWGGAVPALRDVRGYAPVSAGETERGSIDKLDHLFIKRILVGLPSVHFLIFHRSSRKQVEADVVSRALVAHCFVLQRLLQARTVYGVMNSR